MMVMIVKTSDDSSCPLCGDCSLINLAAEILPPWAKMRKAFPFLLLLLLFLYIFRCWLDEMRRFLLKYDRKENWSTTRPCKKIIIPSPLLAITPHTSIPLFASCLIRISPLATLLTIRLSFFKTSLKCWMWALDLKYPKNISPSLSTAFHPKICFPMLVEIIGMWLIKAREEDGMTVNQPSQCCRPLPSGHIEPCITHYKLIFYLGCPGGLLGLSHMPCQSMSRTQIQPRASFDVLSLFSPCLCLSQPLWNVQKVIWIFLQSHRDSSSVISAPAVWGRSYIWLIWADIFGQSFIIKVSAFFSPL